MHKNLQCTINGLSYISEQDICPKKFKIKLYLILKLTRQHDFWFPNSY